MSYKTIKTFYDTQSNNKLYRIGDLYEGPRFEELLELGYLESAQESEEETVNLEELKVDDLKKLAKEQEVEGYSDMKKAELIEALQAE